MNNPVNGLGKCITSFALVLGGGKHS